MPALMQKTSESFGSVVPTFMCPTASGPVVPTPAGPGRAEPIRLMFLTQGLATNDSDRMAAELITRLNPHRFDSSLCSLRGLGPIGERLAHTIPVASHVLHHRLDLPAGIRLSKQLKGRIDVVLTVGSGEPMSWGCVAARWAGIPVVMSILDSHERPATLTLSNRLLLHWSDGLITAREEQRRHFIERLRLATSSIHAIPPGIDTQRFSFQPSGAFAVRQQFQIPAGAPLCGLSTTNWSELLLRRMFDVIRQVRFQEESAQFVFLGPPAPQSALTRRLQQAGLSGGVHVVEVSDDLPRVLSAMNVVCFVGPSSRQPLLAWQAMAVQVPVVATRDSELAALDLADNANCWATADDVNELAGHVVQFIRDPLLSRGLGERARQYVRKHRSLEVMVRRYERLIVETYHRKRSGPGGALPAALHDTVEFCGAAP